MIGVSREARRTSYIGQTRSGEVKSPRPARREKPGADHAECNQAGESISRTGETNGFPVGFMVSPETVRIPERDTIMSKIVKKGTLRKVSKTTAAQVNFLFRTDIARAAMLDERIETRSQNLGDEMVALKAAASLPVKETEGLSGLAKLDAETGNVRRVQSIRRLSLSIDRLDSEIHTDTIRKSCMGRSLKTTRAQAHKIRGLAFALSRAKKPEDIHGLTRKLSEALTSAKIS